VASCRLRVTDFAGKFKGRTPTRTKGGNVFASTITSTDVVAACLPILSKSDVGQASRILPPAPARHHRLVGRNQEEFDMKSSLFALACLAGAAVSASAQAQSTVTYEDRSDGMRYRVTHQVTQRSVPTTEIQTREQKVYQPQVTTEYQSYQQTYLTPVTQYQWEPHLRNPLGLLGTPYWTHELRPVTHWEARPATVQIPVAKTNWVETTQTTQVPVTTYRPAQAEVVYAEPVGPSGSNLGPASSTTTAVASRSMGGQQLQSDPPRAQSTWATSPSGNAYR